ncbi:hypothetical protein P353_15300 [Comamonas testosteroni]|uniref:Uncharacterized protein n=1 Tax=Comamonas testosteroni TaxID=285 RepID=A0A096FF53_COMTE|nr:hypothetical protein P353_15300 [Comamonas testosteroni]
MAESSACGIEQTVELTKGIDLPTFVRSYLSREHRDNRAAGCTMAALGSDAAHQTQEVKRSIESLLQAFEQGCSASEREGNDEVRAKSIDTCAYRRGPERANFDSPERLAMLSSHSLMTVSFLA